MIRQGTQDKTLLPFFHEFGKERCLKLKYVCSDIWVPSLKVIRKKASNALNIRFRAKGLLSSGPVECLNHKTKLIVRKAYGSK